MPYIPPQITPGDLDRDVSGLISDPDSAVRGALDPLLSGGGGGASDSDVAGFISTDTSLSNTAVKTVSDGVIASQGVGSSLDNKLASLIATPTSQHRLSVDGRVKAGITGQAPNGDLDTKNSALIGDSSSKTRLALDGLYSGGGGGAVSSVNGKTGAVTLTASDVDAVDTGTFGQFAGEAMEAIYKPVVSTGNPIPQGAWNSGYSTNYVMIIRNGAAATPSMAFLSYENTIPFADTFSSAVFSLETIEDKPSSIGGLMTLIKANGEVQATKVTYNSGTDMLEISSSFAAQIEYNDHVSVSLNWTI